MLIPGGFGIRGIEGKIAAARFARENGVPYLGVCLGMQVAVVEFARHVVGLDGANSSEFDPETPLPGHRPAARAEGGRGHGRHHAPGLRSGQAGRRLAGRTPPTASRSSTSGTGTATRSTTSCARSWSAKGLLVSGTSPDERLVEVIELPDHPWFVASQYHPEFKSRPNRPQPLFRDFVGRRGGARPRRGHGARRRDDQHLTSAVRLLTLAAPDLAPETG